MIRLVNNKGLLFILSALLLINCATADTGIKPDNPGYIEPERDIYNSWSLYSKGLGYMSAGDYNSAIKYLMDAATFRQELHRVYYHIAESHYLLKNYETAVSFSELAIKEDNLYSKPYLLLNRIYLDLNNTKKAVDILEKLIDIHPEILNVHYTLGLLNYKLRNYDKAIVSFRNILEISNVVPVEDYYKEKAYYYIARIYYHKNLIDRAVEHLKLAIEINPDNSVVLYLLSNMLIETYKFSEAKQYSLQYINMFGMNHVIYANLGRIFYIEDKPQADRFLREAMYSEGIYKDLSNALYLELLHKDSEAEPLLRGIVSSNPLLLSPHIALARLSLRKNDKKTASSELFTAGIMSYKAGQYEVARSLFTKVISINDDIPEAYFYLGKIYEDNQKKNLAIIYYKKTNKLKPNSEIQIHIGYLYSLLNNFEDATEYIDMAILEDPENSKPYFFKGLAFSRNNNYIEAEKLIKKAIELKSSDDTYYFYLATVQEKQNKIDDTIKSLRKAIEYNPENAMVYNYLGYLFADYNINLDESVTLIQKALSLSPSNGAYLDSLGWAYYKKGDLKLALKKLLLAEKQLDKEESPDPVVYDHIGDVYNKIGEKGKALKYWEKSNKLKNDSKIQEKINESFEK
ncbi:MAG: tetratricopeptide repeat protein [Spirochaetes bacterium]|nr:tetratricopeptide repeat protein [Spirochaetota bacterium]